MYAGIFSFCGWYPFILRVVSSSLETTGIFEKVDTKGGRDSGGKDFHPEIIVL